MRKWKKNQSELNPSALAGTDEGFQKDDTELKDNSFCCSDTCPECGAKLNFGDKYCLKCGIEVNKGEDTLPCPFCGSEIQYREKSCPFCGEMLVDLELPVKDEYAETQSLE